MDTLDRYDVEAMIRDARSEIRGEIDREVQRLREELRRELREEIENLGRVLDSRTGHLA